MSEEATQSVITSALDACLLTDEEMKVYEGAREVGVGGKKVVKKELLRLCTLLQPSTSCPSYRKWNSRTVGRLSTR